MTHRSSVASAISRPLRHALAVALLAAAGFTGEASATTYRIIELPQQPDGTAMAETDLNAAGDVAGSYFDSEQNIHACVWRAPDYLLQPLPEGDATGTQAGDINDNGTVLGVAQFPDSEGSWVPVMWKPDGTLIRLAAWLDGKGSVYIADINNHDTVVGTVRRSTERPQRPAIWLTPQTVRTLGAANPDFESGQARALNDSGTVVGSADFGDATHAFRWTPRGGMRDLGDLPGGGDSSVATGLNESGQVIGYGASDLGTRAVMWEADGSMANLGELPGGQGFTYYGNDINESGVAVGYFFDSSDGFDEPDGFVWTAGSGMLRMRDLIDPLDPLYDRITQGVAHIYLNRLNDAGVINGGLVWSPGEEPVPIMLVPQP